jgi:hypothetical protein
MTEKISKEGSSKFDIIWKLTQLIMTRKENSGSAEGVLETYAQCASLVNRLENGNFEKSTEIKELVNSLLGKS